MRHINLKNSKITTQAFILWDRYNEINLEMSDISPEVTIKSFDDDYELYVISICNPLHELADLTIESGTCCFYGTVYVKDFHSTGLWFFNRNILKTYDYNYS